MLGVAGSFRSFAASFFCTLLILNCESSPPLEKAENFFVIFACYPSRALLRSSDFLFWFGQLSSVGVG